MRQSPDRPKNVIVVDADNPMVEIQGEFFWREDHDAIVATATDEAYQNGFTAGYDAARAERRIPILVVRQAGRRRLARRLLMGLIAFAFGAALLLSAAQVALQH